MALDARLIHGDATEHMSAAAGCNLCIADPPYHRITKEHMAQKRGYAGFNPKYPALSEFKRPGNVWTDLPELFKPTRTAEKPVSWFSRLIAAHSNEGDLVFDPFCGTGNSLVAARDLGRSWVGCETDANAHAIASEKL